MWFPVAVFCLLGVCDVVSFANDPGFKDRETCHHALQAKTQEDTAKLVEYTDIGGEVTAGCMPLKTLVGLDGEIVKRWLQRQEKCPKGMLELRCTERL